MFLQLAGHFDVVKLELTPLRMPCQVIELVLLLGHCEEFNGKLPFLQASQLFTRALGQVLIDLLESSP